MSESVAPDDDTDAPSTGQLGELIAFQKSASVEYDGEASRLVSQLADLAIKTATLSHRARSSDVVREALRLLDRLSERMCVIDEHIEILEAHADLILECMTEEENAYFINDSKRSPHTVTSLIKKRCRTVRIQKMVVGATGAALPIAQDNDQQKLIDCDGSLACRFDATVMVK